MTALDPAAYSVTLPIHFRAAEAADLPKLEWYGQYAHYRNLFRRAYREQIQGRRLMLLADCQSFPIGHVFIQFTSNNPVIADGRQRAYLYSFRVMEMFRGRGIGTRLLAEAEHITRSRGMQVVTLAVSKENPGALRLYERLGYEIFADEAGRWSYTDHNGVIQNVNEPCWLLEKWLRLR
jgi:GNAT superfamily N-acetyltransferase